MHAPTRHHHLLDFGRSSWTSIPTWRLKGLNILVTPSRRACIADFGISSIANSITVRFTHSTVTARAGTARYQAPELVRMENPAKVHYGSDIYAFACVCYEILTGQVPFHELQNDMAVIVKVTGGYRPSRPTSSSSGTSMLDNLWQLLRNCWEGEADKRPTASEAVKRLEGPSIGATPTPFTADWDEKFTSKFRRSVEREPLLPSVAQTERILFGDEKAQGVKTLHSENRFLNFDPACRECRPSQETSNCNKQTPSAPAWQSRQRYEEEPAESNSDDSRRERPGARNSKRRRLSDVFLASDAV
ncbi:Protein kinase domain-containing protein [Mycena sanguinolenta]|uniref:Protein kinase domain-containing protein n=1 Tax=Mycena sanguinolenta TaxID=230812 RepID=A0A8H6ZHL9_9AGAR|nr:Protein kinase domain-containing protein [Mycena sanguinolenta]